MPVILDAQDHALWLDSGVEGASELLPVLRPQPAEAVRAFHRPGRNAGLVEQAQDRIEALTLFAAGRTHDLDGWAKGLR